MMRILKPEQPCPPVEIRSVDDWRTHAAPKAGKKQWKPGRSAMELANAWFPTPGSPSVPPELTALLDSHPHTRGMTLSVGHPEKTTALDDFAGGKRNHDLVLVGAAGGREVCVCVEAKADEPFGAKTVAQYLASVAGTRSNVPERIRLLCEALLGKAHEEEQRFGQLRYQLLTAAAGTVIEAKGQTAQLAVFVVHEFLTDKTRVENIDRNREDLDRFLAVLLGKRSFHLTPGRLHGPIMVHGGRFVPAGVPLLVGKIARDLRPENCCERSPVR